VGPRAGRDAVEKRKIPSSCRDSNLQSSSPRYTTELSRLLIYVVRLAITVKARKGKIVSVLSTTL